MLSRLLLLQFARSGVSTKVACETSIGRSYQNTLQRCKLSMLAGTSDM